MVMTAYCCRIVCFRRRYACRIEDTADCVISTMSVFVIPKYFFGAVIFCSVVNSCFSSLDDGCIELLVSSTS